MRELESHSTRADCSFSSALQQAFDPTRRDLLADEFNGKLRGQSPRLTRAFAEGRLVAAYMEPVQSLQAGGQYWQMLNEVTPEPPALLLDTLPRTHQAVPVTQGLDNCIIGWKEVIATAPALSASVSASLQRQPTIQTGISGSSKQSVGSGPRSGALGMTFVRGKGSYMPFRPGGLDETPPPASSADADHETQDEADSRLNTQASSSGWRTVARGLGRGLNFEVENSGSATRTSAADELLRRIFGNANLNAIPKRQDMAQSKGEPIGSKTKIGQSKDSALSDSIDRLHQKLNRSEAQNIDDLLPIASLPAPPVVNRSAKRKREWAHVIDVNRELTNFTDLVPEMAHKYSFELDTFQKEAVYHLEMGDSVFVAAHTSAGKTVVAEYAISLAMKHMTRAIYTSPIKALSNQKFRDFKTTFGSDNVGILTGDVQINAEASCLIMTTEILRSMLYRGADLIRDLEFVIFDEVHYVNDAERGVVWEEVIIMLPEHVNIILLSATVPNTLEFASWVGRTKKKDIYVISTAKRPVPLRHHLWAGKELHTIVDEQGRFLSEGYKAANESIRRKQDKEREAAGLPVLQRTGGPNTRGSRGRGTSQSNTSTRGGSAANAASRGSAGTVSYGAKAFGGAGAFDKNVWIHLVQYLRKAELLPVVVFTFSKKRCEDNASSLSGQDLCSASEKSEIHVTIEKALARLTGSDKRLPQILRMRDLLSRGLGVHHGGLLPIVKEVVELLFQKGLVKVLFATETFAMGVNMPAKCVVFSGIRKHDGQSFRTLLPGEYTQMAGRAGRRGLDVNGTVIIIGGTELPDQVTLKDMMLGKPSKLISQFRLTYNMILNLLRVEALRVEEMIKRSFSENAAQSLAPEQQASIAVAERKLAALPALSCENCSQDIDTYYLLAEEILRLDQEAIRSAACHLQGSKTFSPGRVVAIHSGTSGCTLALLLRPTANWRAAAHGQRTDSDRAFWVLVPSTYQTAEEEGAIRFLNCLKELDQYVYTPTLAFMPPSWPLKTADAPSRDVDCQIIDIDVGRITMVVNRAMSKIDVTAILDKAEPAAIQNAREWLLETWDTLAGSCTLPEVDWSRMRSHLDFQETLRRRDSLAPRLDALHCRACDSFQSHLQSLHRTKQLEAELQDLKMALSDQNLELLPDYEQRTAVLKELQYIDAASTVLLKGRVACEINSANELVLTEIILENTLAEFTPEEAVALLSIFVFVEKTDSSPDIPDKLQAGLESIYAAAGRVERVQDRKGVAHDDFFTKFKPGLVEVVYEWARGMPFEQITELTDVAEGTIVRCITRLDETCREVRDAARVIGDKSLFTKMEEAQLLIKRDIVFAASLYF